MLNGLNLHCCHFKHFIWRKKNVNVANSIITEFNCTPVAVQTSILFLSETYVWINSVSPSSWTQDALQANVTAPSPPTRTNSATIIDLPKTGEQEAINRVDWWIRQHSIRIFAICPFRVRVSQRTDLQPTDAAGLFLTIAHKKMNLHHRLVYKSTRRRRKRPTGWINDV